MHYKAVSMLPSGRAVDVKTKLTEGQSQWLLLRGQSLSGNDLSDCSAVGFELVLPVITQIDIQPDIKIDVQLAL